MRKFLIATILIGLVLTFASCNLFDSNDDYDIVTLPVGDDSPYIVSVRMDYDLISIYADWDVDVDTVVVLVDGQNITNTDADSTNLVRFSGSYAFEENETYHIDVTINNVHHESIDLKMVCVPEVTTPEELQEGVDAEITWNLAHDALTQIIYLEHYPDGDISEEPEVSYYYLPGLQRDYTMKAGSFGFTDESCFYIDLEEYNWTIQGDFRFMSNCYVSAWINADNPFNIEKNPTRNPLPDRS